MFILFYCLPYNTLYHLRDWSHGVERFALSECILLLHVLHIILSIQLYLDNVRVVYAPSTGFILDPCGLCLTAADSVHVLLN